MMMITIIMMLGREEESHLPHRNFEKEGRWTFLLRARALGFQNGDQGRGRSARVESLEHPGLPALALLQPSYLPTHTQTDIPSRPLLPSLSPAGHSSPPRCLYA